MSSPLQPIDSCSPALLWLSPAPILLSTLPPSLPLRPRWYEGMLSSGYEGVREIQKRLTNTMGWSATSGMVDNWVYDEVRGQNRLGAIEWSAACTPARFVVWVVAPCCCLELAASGLAASRGSRAAPLHALLCSVGTAARTPPPLSATPAHPCLAAALTLLPHPPPLPRPTPPSLRTRRWRSA